MTGEALASSGEPSPRTLALTRAVPEGGCGVSPDDGVTSPVIPSSPLSCRQRRRAPVWARSACSNLLCWASTSSAESVRSGSL